MMAAVIMVILLSGLWLADERVKQGVPIIRWPSALSRRAFRPRDTPRTDP